MSIRNDSTSLRKTWLTVAAITAIGLTLRLYRLDYQSLWSDESFSLVASSASIAELMRQLIDDFVQPPLHYLALKAVSYVFGLDSYTARLLSAIAGTASIPLIFYAGTIFFDRRAGLIAATLLAISQLAVMYSQEARPYALQILLVSALLVFLGLALRHQKSWAWWCAVFTGTLALYTHYYSIFAIAPLFIGAMFGKNRVSFGKLVGGLLIAAILFVPWVFSGIVDVALTSSKTISEQPVWFSVSLVSMFDTFTQFNNGALNGVLDYGPSWAYFIGAFLFTVPLLTITVGQRLSSQTIVWIVGTLLAFSLSIATGAGNSGLALVLLLAGRATLTYSRRSAIANSSIYKIAASPQLWVALLALAFLLTLRQSSPRWILFFLGLMLGSIAHCELFQNKAVSSDRSVIDGSSAASWVTRQSTILLSAAFLVAVAVPIFLGFAGVQFDTRYTLSALPIYYILVAAGIGRINPPVYRNAIIILACLFSLLALRANYFIPYKENWRDSMELVIDSYQVNDCVTMAPTSTSPVKTWFAYGYNQRLPNMRYLPTNRIVEDAVHCPRLWFMQYGRVGSAIRRGEKLRKEVESHHRLVDTWSFHWVEVFLYSNKSIEH